MSKKKYTAQPQPIEEEVLPTETSETPEIQAEIIPVASIVEQANIRPGYVQIRNKQNGGIVIVNAKHVGTVYSTEIWEPVTDEKKR